jgi:hypothetical protein
MLNSEKRAPDVEGGVLRAAGGAVVAAGAGAAAASKGSEGGMG